MADLRAGAETIDRLCKRAGKPAASFTKIRQFKSYAQRFISLQLHEGKDFESESESVFTCFA